MLRASFSCTNTYENVHHMNEERMKYEHSEVATCDAPHEHIMIHSLCFVYWVLLLGCHHHTRESCVDLSQPTTASLSAVVRR